MKNVIKKIFIALSILSIANYTMVSYGQSFDHIITFYLQEYPTITPEPAIKEENNQNSLIPEHIGYHLPPFIPPSSQEGIFASYFGYLQKSNFDGQITLPLIGKTPKKLLITTSIIPIWMVGNTIHHWEIKSDTDTIKTKLYSIEQEHDEPTNLYYWNVKELPLPKNKIITLDTILLFTDPQSIYVPLGIYLTNNNPQVILPTLYVKKNNDTIIPPLLMLNVTQFFSFLSNEYKKYNDLYYSSHLITNPRGGVSP